MKSSKLKSAALSMFLLAGVSIAGAATVTVGPSGQYPDPCTAFQHLSDGDTVQIDANNGIPYIETQSTDSYGGTDCRIVNNNLTIVGVNGRAVLDASGVSVTKGIWDVDGHDIVIDNFEFRNARNGPSNNSEALRIEIGGGGVPNGGNITLQHSYVHDDNTGVLTGGVYDPSNSWYSANPYITFQYDEFVHDGNYDGHGNTHNMYIGYGGNLHFTLQYSWSHDAYVGHTVKDRAPINDIQYNLIGDEDGTTSYLVQFPEGGSDYIVGNILYKSVPSGNFGDGVNTTMFLYADASDSYPEDPEYGTNHQDLHFINNTVVNDPGNTFPDSFVNVSCPLTDNSQCNQPSVGPALSVAAVVENNIFVGPQSKAVNQSIAYVKNNVLEANTPENLAAMFVDAAHLDFHLVAGAPAIQAGLYPPTDNAGAADPKALALYEYVQPSGAVARPTPSGSTMDDGAYSYPRVGTPATITATATGPVTAPGTGTITVTGLPIPPAGQYTFVSFVSENEGAVPFPSAVESTTGTATTTYSVNPTIAATTTVPIDVYAGGGHTVVNVTVNPGPPVLSALTLDYNYAPFSTVHLEGPAPAGGTVINLSSSDPKYLYTPSTVTVPEGQLTAETGTETGSLWGQDPGVANETLTATQGSITKTLNIGVFAPGYHSTTPEYGSIIGSQPLAWCVVMVGFFPPSGGNIQVTSDNPAVVPNQTITSGYGGCNGRLQGQTIGFTEGVNFDGDVAIATNAVSTSTNVNITLNLNGAITSSVITIQPGGGTTPPAPPSALAASATTFKPVNLTWTASPTAGIAYNLYRSTTNGFSPDSTNLIQSGLSGTSYADYTVSPLTTYYYVLEAYDLAGSSSPTNQATATTPAEPAATDLLDIDAGGPAAGNYAADEYFTNGGTYGVTNTIDTSLLTNPGPQAVYQNQRYVQGSPNFYYVIPGLTPGQNYLVRLTFVEQYYDYAGAREFNVVLNGVQVLTNFDTFATAGGAYKAVAEDFETAADQNGQITINFNDGAVDNALINAIQIMTIQNATANLASITQDQAGFAQTTVHLSAPAATDTVVQLSSSNPSVVYAPASVTIPAGQTSAEAGTLLGGLWGQYPKSKSATITATYNGSSKSVPVTVVPPTPSDFSVVSVTCTKAPCSTLHGGNTYTVTLSLAGNAPVGGAPVTLTSSNTAVVQNTSGTFSVGPGSTGTATVTLTTGTVTKPTYVQLTEHFNGLTANISETVQP